MHADEFDRLLSAWLDERGNATLADAVARAVAACPCCAAAHREHLRIDDLLRTPPPWSCVDWSALRERILQRASQRDIACLRDATQLPASIDWKSLHNSIVRMPIRPKNLNDDGAA